MTFYIYKDFFRIINVQIKHIVVIVHAVMNTDITTSNTFQRSKNIAKKSKYDSN